MKPLKLGHKQKNSFQYQIYERGSVYLLDSVIDAEDLSFIGSEDLYNQPNIASSLGHKEGLQKNNINESTEKHGHCSLTPEQKEILAEVSNSKKEIEIDFQDQVPSKPASFKLGDLLKNEKNSDLGLSNDFDTVFFNKINSVPKSVSIYDGVWSIIPNFDENMDILFLGDPTQESTENFDLKLDGPYFDLLFRISVATKIPLNKFGFINHIKVGENKFEESEALANYLQIIKPKFLVTLGAQAFQFMTNSKSRLSSVHGKKTQVTFQIKGEPKTNLDILPTFHPEYILINPKIKKTVWEDLQILIKTLL